METDTKKLTPWDILKNYPNHSVVLISKNGFRLKKAHSYLHEAVESYREEEYLCGANDGDGQGYLKRVIYITMPFNLAKPEY